MNTPHATRILSGVLFGFSLVLSWLVTTPLTVWAFWSGPRTRDALVAWIGLWAFTVAVPTLQAALVHRRMNDVLTACPGLTPRVRRDLAHTRFVLLMCGSMTVLTVIGLRIMARP